LTGSLLLRINLDVLDEAQSVPICRGTVRYLLQALAVDQERAADIELALSEATGNVIRHAYAEHGNRYRVAMEFYAHRVRLQIRDEGRGFHRAALSEPDLDSLGGRGLWIIERLADAVAISTLPGGGCCLEAEFALPTRIEFESPPCEDDDCARVPVLER
jgi:serine/threonine-protein kinase RsbW